MPRKVASARSKPYWGEFQAVLKNELARRKQTNPRYSARKFAQSIGVSNGAISEILAGKRVLPLDTCVEIAPKLRLEAKALRRLMAVLEAPLPKRVLVPSKKDAEILKDWLAHAILGLYELEVPELSNAWIARKLNQPLEEVESRVTHLLKVGLLQKDESGKIFRITESWDTRSLWSAEEVVDLHTRAFDLTKYAARKSKARVVLHRRLFPAAPEVLEFARAEMERISDTIDAMAEASSPRTELLQLAFQVFQFDFEE